MAEATTEDKTAKSPNPLVFISHDTRDAELAEAFSNLLKSVSAGVLKSFRTSDRRGNQGIEYGVEWYPEIIKNIQGASDVVCLLTQRSVDRPWILFEAGMAKGKLDTPILGVALGIELKDASSGPFAQFQNCGDDEESITKLVFQLVNRIPNSEPDEETVKFQVSKFKQNINKILQKIGEAQPKQVNHKQGDDLRVIENNSAKLFEEIKIMFQDLPSRIDRSSLGEKRKRRRRVHPGMIDDIVRSTNDPKIGLFIALSFYRDIMPWIYDGGVALINKIEASKSVASTGKFVKELESLLTVGSRSPYIEELIIEDPNEHYLLHELPSIILKNINRLIL